MDDSKFKTIGIEYDDKLIEKYPDIDATKKENNGNIKKSFLLIFFLLFPFGI